MLNERVARELNLREMRDETFVPGASGGRSIPKIWGGSVVSTRPGKCSEEPKTCIPATLTINQPIRFVLVGLNAYFFFRLEFPATWYHASPLQIRRRLSLPQSSPLAEIPFRFVQRLWVSRGSS